MPKDEPPTALERRDTEKRVLFTQAFFFARELLDALDQQSPPRSPEPMEIWLRMRDADERNAIEQVSPGFIASFAEMVSILKTQHEAAETVDAERKALAVEAMLAARSQLHKLPAEYLVGTLPPVAFSVENHPAAGRWADKRVATRED